jgi:hypothetical protein
MKLMDVGEEEHSLREGFNPLLHTHADMLVRGKLNVAPGCTML